MSPECPVPLQQYPHVLLAHGGGGRLMHHLLSELLCKAFSNPILDTGHDSAQLSLPPGRIAMSTDSFVVQPLFFPGGDIGSLAIHGTVNDLAMSGARPLHLSCALIIEEGLPMSQLWRIVTSMRDAADRCNVQIVTGDTKVVERGKGDGLFINTTGIGILEHNLPIAPQSVQPGDSIVLSGDLGRHGIAIMASREGLDLETTIESDSAPVHAAVLDLLQAGVNIHCLRDLTRGGLASALNEIASSSRLTIEVDRAVIPVQEPVHAACELLGLDPLHVANEGRFIAFIPPEHVPLALERLRTHEGASEATVIGSVATTHGPRVILKSALGPRRILDMPSGEQLPRIC